MARYHHKSAALVVPKWSPGVVAYLVHMVCQTRGITKAAIVKVPHGVTLTRREDVSRAIAFPVAACREGGGVFFVRLTGRGLVVWQAALPRVPLVRCPLATCNDVSAVPLPFKMYI